MHNKEFERKLHELFIGLNKETENILIDSRINKAVTDRIMQLVSGSISAKSEGYMTDMYWFLENRIREEDFFKNPDNLNAFYSLNLREEINNKYKFNIENINAYKTGVEYKKVNRLYLSLITAASTMVAGILLKFALSSILDIPFFLIILGTLSAACSLFFVNPGKSKSEDKKYKKAVNKFLSDLDNDILNWFAGVEEYFDQKVRSLYE